MARIKRRKNNKFFFSSKSFRPAKRRDIKGSLINSAIVILSLLLVAFIFSFSNRQIQTGIPIEITFPSLPETPKLAVAIYEQKPILDIEVEILNGCGVPGLAGKISDYLRSQQMDVVRSENADHYNYDQTILILRNENSDGLKIIAKSFGIDIKDENRIKHIPDDQLNVDITVIIGSDFATIKPLVEYLKYR
ncbi:MAG TPA: LytR family transcriptional regulator [Candidatus Marinimicrobia bacterium]|nr:LytR family transcriptional regulator [Candidatus Neomarinimicrobiota bacterium]